MTRKKFKDLDLSNAFLFSAALADKETCRMVLEIILGHSVGAVNVRAEHRLYTIFLLIITKQDVWQQPVLNNTKKSP